MKQLTILVLFCLALCSCKKQHTTNTIAATTINTATTMNTTINTKDYPGYYIQINNQNCHYELRINDFLSEQFFDSYPAYSVRVPINPEILKSGKQQLQLTVLPFKDTVLSKQAHISLKIMRYNNMKDPENEYGGFTEVFNWDIPEVTPNLPVYVLKTEFNAKVPYNYTNVYKTAVNLADMDEAQLLKEVVGEYKKLHTMLANRNAKALINYLYPNDQRRGATVLYQDDAHLKMMKGIIEEETLDEDYVLEPLQNYHMVLYGKGRVVRLLRNDNNDNILWSKHKEEEGSEGAQIIQLYKNKNTGKWHQW